MPVRFYRLLEAMHVVFPLSPVPSSRTFLLPRLCSFFSLICRLSFRFSILVSVKHFFFFYLIYVTLCHALNCPPVWACHALEWPPDPLLRRGLPLFMHLDACYMPLSCLMTFSPNIVLHAPSKPSVCAPSPLACGLPRLA